MTTYDMGATLIAVGVLLFLMDEVPQLVLFTRGAFLFLVAPLITVDSMLMKVGA